MAQDDAAAKAAAEKEAQEKAAKAAAEKAAAKIVCLTQPVIIAGVEQPRGYELAADSEVVKRALAPFGLVMTKPLFDKIDAAEKAQAQAAAEIAAAGVGD